MKPPIVKKSAKEIMAEKKAAKGGERPGKGGGGRPGRGGRSKSPPPKEKEKEKTAKEKTVVKEKSVKEKSVKEKVRVHISYKYRPNYATNFFISPSVGQGTYQPQLQPPQPNPRNLRRHQPLPPLLLLLLQQQR